MGFYRKVSPTEISYLATDSKESSPYVNRFIVEGEGDLNLDDWRSAFKVSLEANPGMGLKLKGYWGWRSWYQSEFEPEIKIVESNWDGVSSENAPLELTGRINPRKEFPIRIDFIRNISKKTNIKVLFSIHHAITDGMGAIRWVKDVFRALNGKPCFGALGTVSDIEVQQKVGNPPLSIVRGHCLPLVAASESPATDGYRWRRVRWQGSNRKILARLLLVFNQLARAEHGNGKVLFRIPSDLRSYLDPKQPYTLTNCTGAIDILVHGFDTVDTIEAGILESKSNREDLSVFLPQFKHACWLPKKVFRTNPKAMEKHHKDGVCAFSALVSHLGKTNYPSYSYEQFQATNLYGVPTPVGEGFYVGIMSDNDGANICIGAPKALVNADQLQQFCLKVVQGLKRLETQSNGSIRPMPQYRVSNATHDLSRDIA